MLRLAAAHAVRNNDTLLAYSLLEFGNNLRLVLRGEETLDAFRQCYVGFDGDPFDLEKVFDILTVAAGVAT